MLTSAPAAPSGPAAEFAAGTGNTDDGTPRASVPYAPHSLLDQIAHSSDGFAPGPSSSDRRLIGMGPGAGLLPTPNGSAMDSYDAIVNANQFRSL